jgi:hypothetical protein
MMKLEDILGEKGVTDPLVMAGQFSPDGQIFSFLRGRPKNPSVMDLWGFDLIAKKPILLMDSDQLMKGSEPSGGREERGEAGLDRDRVRATAASAPERAVGARLGGQSVTEAGDLSGVIEQVQAELLALESRDVSQLQGRVEHSC